MHQFRSIALLALALLSGCGGGGPDSGACAFAPSNCVDSQGGAPGAGTGSSTPFSRSGVGDTAFVLPASVSIIRVQAQLDGTSSNFIVRAGSDLVVNTIVGTGATPQTHDGTYVVTAGSPLTISNANGVNWTINSSSAQSPPASGLFSKSGSGDQVFDLPSRSGRYRVTGAFPGTSSNFIVYVSGSLAINSIIGSSQSPTTFDGVYTLPINGRVETRNSSGVSWSFVELP